MWAGGERGKVIDGKKVSSCYKGEIMKSWGFFGAPVISHQMFSERRLAFKTELWSV